MAIVCTHRCSKLKGTPSLYYSDEKYIHIKMHNINLPVVALLAVALLREHLRRNVIRGADRRVELREGEQKRVKK